MFGRKWALIAEFPATVPVDMVKSMADGVIKGLYDMTVRDYGTCLTHKEYRRLFKLRLSTPTKDWNGDTEGSYFSLDDAYLSIC